MRFSVFLVRFLGFCNEKLRFLGFVGRFFGFFSTRFFSKNRAGLDFSLSLSAVRMLGYFICFYFTVNPGQIAMWHSGFFIEVYGRLCQALDQYR